MELKKNKNKTVTRFRTLFRNVGFVITLCLVIMAFEWKWKVVGIVIPDERIEIGIMLPPIESTDQKLPERPEPPKEPPTRLAPVEPILDPTVKPDEMQQPFTPPSAETDYSSTLTISSEPEEPIEPPALYAEVKAEPVIGMTKWNKRLAKEIGRELERKRIEVEGKAHIKIVVEKDGSLTEFEVLMGTGNKRIDAMLMKLIREGGEWKPARQGGRRVRYQTVLPILLQ